MNQEALRLRTFRNWPINSPVCYRRLAKAGFYYTGQAQVVQCFLCGVTVSEWNFGDQALTVHSLANSNCPFVLDPISTCNVPLITSNLDNPNSHNDIGDNEPGRSEEPWMRGDIETNDYLDYSMRLQTFNNWPVPFISPERLARSGFYYLQQNDIVECAFCRGVVLNWKPGDDPDQQHRLHYPNCKFYLQQNKNGDQSSEKVEFSNVKLMPGSTSNLGDLGIQQHSAPKQTKYATFEARLNTFQGWPTQLKQTPEMLAEAGFYYVGVEDQVRCFHCDGGLRNWEETDDVWIEHAKWFPKCRYVSIVQGPNFVKHCIENRSPIDPAVFVGISENNNSRTPSASSESADSHSQRHIVTDSELDALLNSEPAKAALEIGLHVGRVKMALKRRMEEFGVAYENGDQLIEDATRLQLSEEDNINASSESPGSPSSELTYLLNQIITSTQLANNSESQGDNFQNQGRSENNFLKANSSVSESTDSSNKMPNSNCKTTEKTVSLEEENRRLKEARLCKICMDREVAVVFLPCSHLSTCIFCAPSLKCCPMCRQEIQATVRTFLA